MGLHGAGSRLPGVSMTSMFSVRGRSVTYDRVRRRRLIFAYSEVPRSGQRPRMRGTTVSKPLAPRLLVLDTCTNSYLLVESYFYSLMSTAIAVLANVLMYRKVGNSVPNGLCR